MIFDKYGNSSLEVNFNLQAWFSPKRRGLVASIVVSGYGFGSCIWTPLQTQYINPNNLNATADDGSTTSCADNKTKYYQDPGETKETKSRHLYSLKN